MKWTNFTREFMKSSTNTWKLTLKREEISANEEVVNFCISIRSFQHRRGVLIQVAAMPEGDYFGPNLE